MRVAVLRQDRFGGTDHLIARAFDYMQSRGVYCEYVSDEFELGITYDLALMPTSEITRFSYYTLRGFKSKKVLVWSMGHGAFKAAFFNPSHQRIIEKYLPFLYWAPAALLRKLVDSDSIIFTDEVGMNDDLSVVRPTSLTKTGRNDRIVPIAIEDPCVKGVSSKSVSLGSLKAGWVGRVSSDFKSEPLIDLLLELNRLGDSRVRISKFYVVGSGDGLSKLKEIVEREAPSFEMVYIENIRYADLPSFVNENFDLAFVMGTSSLDTARSYVPTVVIKPYSLKDKLKCLISKDRKYRFIFNSKGYSLGELPLPFTNPVQEDTNLDTIISTLTQTSYEELAIRSRAYSENFFEDIVFQKLMLRMSEVKINSIGFTTHIAIFSLFWIKKILKLVVR